MADTLPPAKEDCQGKLCCGEIDISSLCADDAPMARDNDLREPILFIGEWIQALDLKPREVVAKAKVSEPYLNQLIHRKKANPSLKVLIRIAEAMGLGLRDLQSPPPDTKVLQAIHRMSPDQIARLRKPRKAG